MTPLRALLMVGWVSTLGAPPAACPEPPAPLTAPWVARGSGKHNLSRAFVGVGLAKGIKNEALARSTAENRARVEITKVFDSFNSALAKAYLDSLAPEAIVSEEQHLGAILKTMSAQNLGQVTIIDHDWLADGSVAALARLDVATVIATVEGQPGLTPAFRAWAPAQVERVYDAMP